MSNAVLYVNASPGWWSSGIRPEDRHPFVGRGHQLRLWWTLMQALEQELHDGRREVGREPVPVRRREQVPDGDRSGRGNGLVERASERAEHGR